MEADTPNSRGGDFPPRDPGATPPARRHSIQFRPVIWSKRGASAGRNANVCSHAMILHADVDAFYASVAQRDDPALRGRPVAVGSWVVMAASYEARAFGVRGGMATARARRLCPDLLIAESRFGDYVEAGRAVLAVFERFAPVVEP